jgi:hypothetical protein
MGINCGAGNFDPLFTDLFNKKPIAVGSGFPGISPAVNRVILAYDGKFLLMVSSSSGVISFLMTAE